MLSMLFETGHPWITFKDACNVRSPQDHAGVISLVQPLHGDPPQHLQRRNRRLQSRLGHPRLAPEARRLRSTWKSCARTIRVAVRALDNVIDINF